MGPVARPALMILTQCPSCRTLFRVDNEALAACGGAVRCGQCAAVFQADVYRLDGGAINAAEPSPARLWPLTVAALLLALLLAAQGLYAARAPLARLALTRPMIQALRRTITLPWGLPHPAALERFHLLAARVTQGADGVLRIRAQLQNAATFRQSLPFLGVTLRSSRGRVVARAHFPARVFLRRPRPTLAPGAVAAVRLGLRVPARVRSWKLALLAAPKR